MKNFLFVFVLFISAARAQACDDYLKKYPRDCKLQDRIRILKVKMNGKNIKADDIAEYRIIRFVDRPSWEKAKLAHTKPTEIYKPAPITWNVWDSGIKLIFHAPNLNGILFRGGIKLNNNTISLMNRVLLTNGTDNIKDPNTDKKKNPGEMREGTDTGVGFCNPGVANSLPMLEVSKKSLVRFEDKWEHQIGMTFGQLVKSKNGMLPDSATLVAAMTQSADLNCKAPNSFVNFIPTAQVAQQLDWLRIFTETNLQLLQKNKPVLSPVELATFVQKWFVTIHPFSDGNGRTSRALQDILLANFDLPFAPAGDLYIDATADWEVYLEQTYGAMERMLDTLEACAKVNYHLPLAERPFYCATVQELIKTPGFQAD